MAFQLLEKNNRVYVSGGMSAEISFAKYVAHRTTKVYAGWDVRIRMVYPEMIIDTLRSVVEHVRIIEPEGCARPVLHSPGFLSVPYMTELCDMVYLPSQFLVGFNSFADLHRMLYVLSSNGIKAYAVAGYDGCIPHCLVAWIKFLEMPVIYDDLIQNHLHSDNVLAVGVYDDNGETIGENAILQYGEKTGTIQPGDVYMLHIHACYGQQTLQKDWEIFRRLAPDFVQEKMSSEKCKYVGDWESAFDIMYNKYYPNYDGSLHFARAHDTLPLYRLSYELTKSYLRINNLPVKGIVANPYILNNNPTYEVNYGYLSYTYWAGSSNVDSDLTSLIEKDMPECGTLWFNDQYGQKLSLYQKLCDSYPTYKKVYISNSNPLCHELTNWIEKYKPKNYPARNNLSLWQLFKVMEVAGVAVK